MKTLQVKSLGNTPYLISEEDNDFIAKGSYGKVVKAYNKDDLSQKLVAKIFYLENIKQYKSAIQQLKIVKQLPKSDYLVNYQKIKLTSKNCIYLIMEYCNGGSLNSYIHKQQFIEQDQIWRFIDQFLKGYKILKQANILHRDIKCDNILIHNSKYKIADFGLSKLIKQTSNNSSVKGSPIYMAPQLYVNQNKDNNKIDVYSFGVCIYYMCFKKYPYLTKKDYRGLFELINDIRNNSLVIPQGRSKKMNDLLQKMLCKQQEKRISWQQLFNIEYKKPITLKNIPFVKAVQNEQLQELKIQIIKTSNTEMKDIELLDFDIIQSLKLQSIVILNELQKKLLYKRQIILYIDKFIGKIQKQNSDLIEQFIELCYLFNRYLITQIQSQLEKISNKLCKNQYKLFFTSKNYIWVCKLIQQDKKGINNLISNAQFRFINKNLEFNIIKIKIYELCEKLVQFFVNKNNLRLAVYAEQIQRYFDNHENSILIQCKVNPEKIQKFYYEMEVQYKKNHFQQILKNRYSYLII